MIRDPNQHNLWLPNAKHELLNTSTCRYLCGHGAKTVAKTPNAINQLRKLAIKYYMFIAIVFRERMSDIKKSIFPDLIRPMIEHPDYWKDTMEDYSKADYSITFKNHSKIMTQEISRKSDPTLSKLKTSLPMNVALVDDCANFFDREVATLIDLNLEKNIACDEVAINLKLLEKGLLKKQSYHKLDEEALYNPELQNHIYKDNRSVLGRYDKITQARFLEPFRCPPQLYLTLNPTKIGYWYYRFVEKLGDDNKPLPEEEAKNYFSVHFYWRDNIDFMTKTEIEKFEREEASNSAWGQMMAKGLPVFESSPLDVFQWEWVQRCYDAGADIDTKTFFYKKDGTTLKDNFIRKKGIDPAGQGDCYATWCEVIEDTETGTNYVIDIDGVEKSSDAQIREWIDADVKTKGFAQELVGIDANGNTISLDLKEKNKVEITEFRTKPVESMEITRGLKFIKLRDQCYWAVRLLMEQNKIVFCIPHHNRFDEELAFIQTKAAEDNVILLKKKGLLPHSPDFTDAFVMAVCVDKIKEEIDDEIEFDVLILK